MNTEDPVAVAVIADMREEIGELKAEIARLNNLIDRLERELDDAYNAASDAGG